MQGLTPKQTAFLAAYIGEARGVGVTAARIAGYAGNDNVLGVTAFDNLRNPKIAAAIEADKARVRSEGIASREERIKSQHIVWEKILRVIEARAAAYPDDAPGSDTGLLVRQHKVIGTGPNAQTVIEWVFDAALTSEKRQLEQHTAKELGQWVEKQAATDPTGEYASDTSREPVDPADVVSVLGILSRAGALSGLPRVAEVLSPGADGAADSISAHE